MTMTTEETKRVRVKFARPQWELMLASLKNWSDDAVRQGYDSSVERATPAIELVERKLSTAKTDEININMTFNELSYLHIGVADTVLYLKPKENLDNMRLVATAIEDVVMKKFGQQLWSQLLTKTFNWNRILENQA